MAKVPPIVSPDSGPPRSSVQTPGSTPFAPGGSLGGGGSIVVPLLGGALGVFVGMHPAAWGSHTPATQQLFRQAASKRSGRKGGRRSAAKRRRTGKVRVRRVSKARNRVLGSGFRLKKGSPAAKRRMAQLRRMRKRK